MTGRSKPQRIEFADKLKAIDFLRTVENPERWSPEHAARRVREETGVVINERTLRRAATGAGIVLKEPTRKRKPAPTATGLSPGAALIVAAVLELNQRFDELLASLGSDGGGPSEVFAELGAAMQNHTNAATDSEAAE